MKLNLKAEKLQQKETGNVIVLFAITLVIVIILIGFAIDFGLLYCKRSYLNEVGQVAREVRFGELPYITNSKDPNAASREVMERCIIENGIPVDQFRTEFRDTYITNNERRFTIDIYLWDTYEYKFLKLFGIKQQQINVHVVGGGCVSSAHPAGVWHPYR